MRWWDIQNYRAVDWNYKGLNSYVRTQRPTFIDATTDPFSEKELVTMVDRHQLHKIAPILVPDLDLANRHRDLNFLFYPIWLVAAIHKQKINPDVMSDQRNKRISCLNRQPRLHRFLTYYELSKQPWFNEVFISFAGLNNSMGGCGDVNSLPQLYVLGVDIVDYFKEHEQDFPMTKETNYHWENCHSPSSPAYNECWANLATETSVQTFCITEKTTKPIVAGCLFFPVASQGFIATLESMGFDLAMDGIDYKFDSESKWPARVKLCIEEINRVYNQLPDIWATNKTRLQHNSEHLLSDQLLTYCLQDIKNYV